VSKYGNKPCEINGEKYRSMREAARHRQLLTLEKWKHISDLQREVPFVLAPGVKFTGDKRAKPALRYVCDFTYTHKGKRVAEDCKGFRTQTYRMKRHLMLALLGIEVIET
jgi:hypothetical protein